MLKKMTAVLLVSMIITMSGFNTYALSSSSKNKIEAKVDRVMVKIKKISSSIEHIDDKKYFISQLVSRIKKAEKTYSHTSEIYAYLFKYLLDELMTVSDSISQKPIPSTSKLNNNIGKGLSSSQISNILFTHNEYRSEVGLPDLIWSNDVAASAEKWANQLQKESCAFYHSDSEFRNRFGENIYSAWTTNKNFSGDNSVNAIRSFGEEKHDYNYSSNTCDSGKVCGHYTQIVWKDTTKVGCARVSCVTTNKYKEIYVCQYDPAGNYRGEKPY